MVFIGIDVGTGSARAGVFDATGTLLGTGKRDITVFQDGDWAEHSSAEIWQSVCAATKDAVAAAGIDPGDVAGIGFDATCSLVVVGEGGAPLPVTPGGPAERDVIVWMDHRALDQAARINAGEHEVLKYVGGIISPEMQTPKLLWLKETHPETYGAAWQFFDLSDYLTWRATGSLSRSICTVTCKWTYAQGNGGWDAGYFRAIGLGDMAEDGFRRIGTEVVEAGAPLGSGLTDEAAKDLGLRPGTSVGAGLIDAHAGGLGTVGAAGARPTDRMAYVFGTSSCTMTSTQAPVYVPGVWGPYHAAMVPGLWLNEGGQSTAGAGIAQLLRHHPAYPAAAEAANARGQSVPDYLADAAAATADASEVARRAKGMFVIPEFLGNRAPYANPHTRAVIAGLGMDNGEAALIDLYIAGILGIGYGLREILTAQDTAGAPVRSIVLSGGAGRQDLVRQLLADASGVTVEIPKTDEPVLLGSAILGALAAGYFSSAIVAMPAMSAVSAAYPPAEHMRDWHARRFARFGKLHDLAMELAAG
ncbi:MAG: FGGY-family carbohydrate kinase [Pseudomonadota bacterium]